MKRKKGYELRSYLVTIQCEQGYNGYAGADIKELFKHEDGIKAVRVKKVATPKSVPRLKKVPLLVGHNSEDYLVLLLKVVINGNVYYVNNSGINVIFSDKNDYVPLPFISVEFSEEKCITIVDLRTFPQGFRYLLPDPEKEYVGQVRVVRQERNEPVTEWTETKVKFKI